MFRYSQIRPMRLIAATAIVALASSGCSDDATPTAPTVARDVEAAQAVSIKPRPRTPYISSLSLSSVYVSISGGFTPFTVTVTNPSQKDVPSIYLRGELKSQNNQPPVTATAFLAYCPYFNGIVPKGDCTMTDGITGGATLAPGPGVFTLRVLQQQIDGTMKVLDSKSVDVVLRQF